MRLIIRDQKVTCQPIMLATFPRLTSAYGETLERLRRLQSVTEAALAHLSLDQLLEELLDRVREALGADTCAVLLRDDDVDHADVLNPLLREKGIKSLAGVPLIVHGNVLGVLHVGSLTPRDFTSEDVEFLQLAADRVALGIDHGRLFETERATA